jgi:hypothetical protein
MAGALTTSTISGITLSGSPGNPLIENHSGKLVLWVRWQRTNSMGMTLDASAWFIDQAGGLADGASAKAMTHPSKVKIASGTITAAIFADGEFRGVDTDPVRHGIEGTFQLIREAWQMAQAGEWDKVKAKAGRVEDGLLPTRAAQKFLQARGNDAAMAGLAYLGSLPAGTWKAEPLINRLGITNVLQA